MINFQDYDVVVVGAGLSGAVFARYYADEGKKVLVLEKRNHIAGNLYDYMDEKGNRVQKYGPHSFHTNYEEVNSYVNKYSEWENYILFCNVFMHGKFTPSPFNFKTIEQYYDKDEAALLKKTLLEEYPNRNSVTIVELLKSTNKLVREYANFLFESDYSLYTAKQWGISPSQVDPEVLKRVPVLLNYDEQYFYDRYQTIPVNGFTSFIANILDSNNIKVITNYDCMRSLSLKSNKTYFDDIEYNGIVIYTGEIDRLFDYKYGPLPYRSLKFEMKTERIKSFQNAPVVAYPEDKNFIRITEYTKMPYQDNEWTSYAIEYSQQYIAGENEPYYPVNNEINNKIYDSYYNETRKYKNIILAGRLAKYKYFNMDQVVLDVMNEIKSIGGHIK